MNNSPRLLIVDDNPDNLDLLEAILLDEDYEVVRAENGEMALQLAQREQPDLVLLDIHMPGLNGYQVCDRLKLDVRCKHIPVIFLSALSEIHDKARAFASGGVDYITKPFQELEVLVRVKTHVTLSKAMRDLAEQNHRLQAEIAERSRLERAILETNQQLERLAITDELTGLANRRRFNDYLERECQRAAWEKRPVSLVLGDIDYFKRYNDHFGHQAGDECLKAVARAIKQAARRENDLAARYGGEELAVILPNTHLQGAVEVAERVRLAVLQLQIPHPLSEASEWVTLSLGVAELVPNGDAVVDRLIRLADDGLYLAKSGGRNRVMTRQPPAAPTPSEPSESAEPPAP